MGIDELRARQVMSRVLVAVRPGESPLMAWELMRRAGVHHLPVVEKDDVWGVLSREDLAASWSCSLQEQSERHVGDLLARDRRPRVCPDTPLTRVAAVMLDAGCDAVPVVSTGGLAGLITARDMLRAVAGRVHQDEPQPGEVVTGTFRLEPVSPARG
ncbi:CBS domain-containing protein [Nonomuraea mesophila]|uniref:CBS domain-containing protein n=1 Tax=Nonomuraea mesophila TaxID=2530382 RepID=A0A4R5FX25_9ACTN|nr:CBS domain-containing protein [Nonomuraea mesophila]TDE59733.1 CBS domain-containing protein [Nonomuraea mesophila]